MTTNIYAIFLGLAIGVGFYLYKSLNSPQKQQQSYSSNPRPPPAPDSNRPGPSSLTTCTICVNYVANEDQIAKLACGHCFHYECITRWLLESSVCPNCRRSLS